jgi:imidazolonepropionase-like amidohydrolase
MRALHAGVGDMISAALSAGVAIYAGSDAGGMVAHGRLVDEIEALWRAGMSRTDALAAGSWSAREWLGHPVITEGAPADLLVYDADPREDLAVLRSPRHILLNGTLIR